MAMETRSRRRRRASWADLPEDMLGDVLRGLPSFGDRARLRAVCRGWRAVALRSGPLRQPTRRRHPPHRAPPGGRPQRALHRFARRLARPRPAGGIRRRRHPLPAEPVLLREDPAASVDGSGRSNPQDRHVVRPGLELRRRCHGRLRREPQEDRREPAGRGTSRRLVAGHPGVRPAGHRVLRGEAARARVMRRAGRVRRRRAGPPPPRAVQAARGAAEQLPPPPAAKTDDGKVHVSSRRYLLECNARLLTVIRYLRYYKTVMIEVHALQPDDSWARVKAVAGRALFVGDACSGSFPGATGAAASTSHDMIREGQVCFVDDEMAISDELDSRNRSPLIRTVEAYGLRGRRADAYRSVLANVHRDLGRRCLRTVEAYVVSERCGIAYRPKASSARTGRWRLETVQEFPRSIPTGHGLRGAKDHEDFLVI